MLPVAKKYELFEGTLKSIEELKKFEDNFEKIKDCLIKIEGSLKESIPSNFMHHQETVEKINNIIRKELAQENIKFKTFK